MNLPEMVLEIKSLVSPGSVMKLAVSAHDNDYMFYNEAHFRYMLRIERMRTERSKKPFILLLLNISKLMSISCQEETIACIKTALIPSLREVDIRGWYDKHHTIGIIFTEMAVDHDNFMELVIYKIYDRFYERLDSDWIKNIDYSFHHFPEAVGASFNDELLNRNHYPDKTSSVPYG
ncbi:MAG: hypothetical protein CVU51_01650 [Deltaproteobacteria bacterium HGW-Deltaproteobacteria-1]|nr:MAG: hypothetical protein CVU51_01650 [Deltaproteobacteria bacterium HGW-Deltaproteobacteria-1]